MTELQPGDVFQLEVGQEVYAHVPRHFSGAMSERGCWEVERQKVTIAGELAYLAGTYVVMNTTFDGGSHSTHDPWPDAHHVWAQRVPEKSKDYPNDLGGMIHVDFFQHPQYGRTTMNIQPQGKAKLTWTVEER